MLYRPPTVPFPAALIDRWMPVLRDTEWRVLCVVVRSTLGWQDAATGGRKARDWISHSQMLRRTGRASEAVSRAVDSLVLRGLIETLSRAGKPLATPAARRRHGERVYYRVSTGVPRTAEPRTSSETEIRKAMTTKERGTKR